MENLYEADSMRNKTLASAKDYDKRSTSNAEFNLDALANAALDTMPLFTTAVAAKVASKTQDIVRAATISSISFRIDQQEDMKTVDKAISYTKTQQKDALYDYRITHVRCVLQYH